MAAVKETHTPDRLIAGAFPLVTGNVTLAASEGTLARGSVLGKVTATGKYKLTDKASSDGSEVASMILAEDTDITEEVENAPVYLSGQFAESAVVFGGESAVADHKDELRGVGIYLVEVSAQ